MLNHDYLQLGDYVFNHFKAVGASRPRVFKNGGVADGKVYAAWRKEMEARLLSLSYKDHSLMEGIQLRVDISCEYAMPKSWSNKKRDEYISLYKRSKPDLDNIAKSILDAMFKEDEAVVELRARKSWGIDNLTRVVVYQCVPPIISGFGYPNKEGDFFITQ